MLAAGERMCAYRFEGYWKDVGTIDSLWEANMDLLDPNVPLDLSDTEWQIYSRNPGLPPHYIADGACVQNSMISEGCNIYGNVDFSVLFSGVTIEEGAEVRDSIIMPGACVRRGCKGAIRHLGGKRGGGGKRHHRRPPRGLHRPGRLGRGGGRRGRPCRRRARLSRPKP